MTMKFTRLAALIALAAPLLAQAAAAPRYVITDLGVAGGNTYSQGFAVSNSGGFIAGRTLAADGVPGTGPAFIYSTTKGSMTALDLQAGRDFASAYGVNDGGIAVGRSSVTVDGSDPRPVMWTKGAITQLAMPAGFGVGRAYDINNNGIAVGSVGSGATEQGVIFNTKTGQSFTIDAFSAQGSYMTTAYGINDAGLVVGFGVNAASRGVALSYNMTSGVMTEMALPAFSGFNSAGAYAVNEAGYIVGTSGNSSQAVLWAPGGASFSVAAFPAASSNGSLMAVNSEGWAVGNSGGVYSNPFLYADGQTYLINDILLNGQGWNFSTTTSAAARGIADNGMIIGTAKFNGVEHAYMMTLAPVPEPATYALMIAGLAGVGFVARRRRAEAA